MRLRPRSAGGCCAINSAGRSKSKSATRRPAHPLAPLLEIFERTQAGALDGRVELLRVCVRNRSGGRSAGTRVHCRPTDADAREGLGHQEPIPGADGPGVLGLQVKGADGRAGHLRQLDGAHLGAVDGAARTVGGKDGRLAAFDHLRQAQQPFARAARAGAAHGMKAEQAENARNQFAVEALADENGGAGAAVIDGAGQHALMPETENLEPRAQPVEKRGNALFGNHFKAPGEADKRKQRPHHARNHGQHKALGEGESGSWLRVSHHDFSVSIQTQILRSGVPQPAQQFGQRSPLAVHENAHAIEARGEPERGPDAKRPAGRLRAQSARSAESCVMPCARYMTIGAVGGRAKRQPHQTSWSR